MSLWVVFDTPVPCTLTPQRYDARIGFLVSLEIGDMQANVKPFVLNCGIKLHQALVL